MVLRLGCGHQWMFRSLHTVLSTQHSIVYSLLCARQCSNYIECLDRGDEPIIQGFSREEVSGAR